LRRDLRIDGNENAIVLKGLVRGMVVAAGLAKKQHQEIDS
jgi:hypothetical protein